jgi:hypothetical protein
VLPDRFWSKVAVVGSCWEWTGSISKNGYGRYRATPNETDYAHRVSAREFIGPCPLGNEVCHSCDNRRCIRPGHLSYGTRTDNVRDAIRKGRHSPPPRSTSESARKASVKVWVTRRERYGPIGRAA